MKKQIIIVPGGGTYDSSEDFTEYLKSFTPSLDSFKRQAWKDSLQSKLGENFDVIRLKMPNKDNAHYEEWKIYFEKCIPLFDERVLLIGHSLGGVFLAKYLSKNLFPKKIMAIFLLAAPYDDEEQGSLTEFKITEKTNLDMFAKQSDKIFLYQSKNDPCVPFFEVEKYKKRLPQAELSIFSEKQHFSMPEFPELVEHIKSLS